MNVNNQSNLSLFANQHSLAAVIEQLRWRSGNTAIRQNQVVQILHDSRENFPQWLEAIESAQHYILIEMYIFADDEFGRKMRHLLIQKQKQGVMVVLIYDWVGSISAVFKRFFQPLEKAGALVVAYNPLGFASGVGLLSRNHRKSFVIDGHTAFVGGLCVSSAWQGDRRKNIQPWRDIGIKIQGDAVYDVMSAFADSLHSQNKKLPENIKFAALCKSDSGSLKAGIVATTPRDNNMMRLDLAVISLANHRLWLTDAYFMPTRLYTQALINAAYAGVDVRILVPKTSDIAWIARVSRTRYRELLRAGVRVFEWNGAMIHAKSAIADGVWARVGSTNLNFASWHVNRELDVIIEDRATVKQLEQTFLDDLTHATEVVLNDNENKVLQQNKWQRLSQLKVINRQQAQAIARQIMELSQAFKGNLHTQTNVIDDREARAYLSLGLTLLGFALLLWFMPRLLVLPLVLLLAVSGGSTVIYALRQRRCIRKNKRNQNVN